MKTKIKYNELNELSSFVISKSEEIQSNYSEIDKIIDSVSDVWAGNDSKEFVKEAKKCITEEKEKVKKIKRFGENLSTIANDYIQMENKWFDRVKKESLDNG